MSTRPPLKLVVFDSSTAAAAFATEFGLGSNNVRGAIALLADGNTIPFIARYRKEQTGGLDEVQIGSVDDALTTATELIDRKNRVLKSIFEQDALDGELEKAIRAAGNAREVDDLYLPYKSTRKTRATLARERGLEPLANLLAAQVAQNAPRASIVAPFVDPAREVDDVEAALTGAGDIIAERWSQDAAIRSWLRGQLRRGAIETKKKRGYHGDDHRFESFYDHREPITRLASHRLLAIRRGEAEGALSVAIEVDDDRLTETLDRRLLTNPRFLFRRELETTVRDCYTRLLKPSLSTEVLRSLREVAERDAIGVFATNLGELLLAPPARQKAILGIDPGFRTGCKVVVIDATGKLVAHSTVYPTAPRNDTEGTDRELTRLIDAHDVELIAIGNGTASRETAAFCARLGPARPGVTTVIVNESGASVYSASATAREEFPDLDLTVRGAVSIARRLQDPLSELVKIEPKSIGVGQYQHDVNQTQLKKALDRVVSSAVNRVGVELNTASVPLLSYVSGIGPKLAQAIVAHREACGRFPTRSALLKVPRFGAKAFEQSAGFLRVRDGAEALDASAVHPESYYVVKKIAERLGRQPRDLLGDDKALQGVDAESFVDDKTGLPTIRDILGELSKPGRDPRQAYEPLRFAEGVDSIDDVATGMRLEGVVTNVTHFGAFVDIGVHQDGLVHISELDTRFVKDPTAVVKVGDRLLVEVLDVDLRRQRISLSRKRALADASRASMTASQ
ncbi:MAG: Tex family protein [Vicinamibacterales bacterium]|nr:Tex family protein [Vicinamibacterales bacterium]HJN46521.1 Tex family protein [Vicinamibacterales bacterium]